MQISSAELRSILEDVEKDLTPLLRSEREKLSKAVGDEDSASASASPMGEESRSAGRDMVPSERSGGSASEGSASASPEGSSAGMPPEGSSASGSPEASEGSASAGGGEGVEALAAEYAKLPPEELEMHLMALEMVLKQHGGGAEGSPAGAPPEAPPAGMPPEGSPAMKKEVSASASASEKSKSPAMKKEMSHSASESSESSSISKSEIDALNQKLDVALKAVEFLTRPMRKAVTEFASEEKPALNLSKNEITAKLKAVTANPTLAKSDRQLINGFYDGRIAVDQIAHLLK